MLKIRITAVVVVMAAIRTRINMPVAVETITIIEKIVVQRLFSLWLRFLRTLIIHRKVTIIVSQQSRLETQ